MDPAPGTAPGQPGTTRLGRGQPTSGGEFQQEGNEREQLKAGEGRRPPPPSLGGFPPPCYNSLQSLPSQGTLRGRL